MADKYEVVPYNSGNGFFVHGGRLGETFIARKEDADLICEALNTVERLKMKQKIRRVADAIAALEDLQKELTEG